MNEKIKEILKKVATTGNLSNGDTSALTHALTEASELLEAITEHVPQHYSEYIVLPRHAKALREMEIFCKKMAPCEHEYVSTGIVVSYMVTPGNTHHGDETRLQQHAYFSTLQQCRFCKTIRFVEN